MKNLLFTLVLLFAVESSAQETSFTYQGNSRNQFYVDIISKVATINRSWGLFGGMRAGYNINENVSIGAVAHGLIPEKLGGTYINRHGRDELHFGYGGAEVSYKHNLSEKFYLTGMMMLGAGRIDYEILPGYDYFFIMEPGASVSYKITEWFGLGYSVNYRFASGVKYHQFSNDSFSGWSADFNIKFGF